MTTDHGRTRALFGQRDFAALWWGQLVSILGDRLNYLALGGLLLEHTSRFADTRQSSILLGVLGNVMLAPVLLFAPFAGPWVDRWNHRRTMLVSDTIRGLLVLAIPLAYEATHHIGTSFSIVFLLFTCNVFFLPAKSAITPEIVPADRLLAANTLLSIAGIAATAVGSICGGWVVDHWGWRVALWIDAASYLVSVVSIALIRYRRSASHDLPAVTLGGYFREIGDGLAAVRASAAVGLALLALGAVWVGGGFLHVAGNQHIQRSASIPGMERIGVLMAVLGVGAGIGTAWVNGPGRRFPRALLLGLGLLLAGGWMIGLAVSTRFAVFAIVAFLVGLCVAPAFVLSETLLQEGTSPAARGRVFSLRDFAMRLGFQVAIAIAALLTPWLGTRTTLLVACGVVSAAGALVLARGRAGDQPTSASSSGSR